jgi:hypothetical protein
MHLVEHSIHLIDAYRAYSQKDHITNMTAISHYPTVGLVMHGLTHE